jgi:hypothetical protein
MRRKPILLKKIAGKNLGKGREVIGLIGTHHGVGVTYTALMLAFYMCEGLGKKTAILECNEHHDMSLIQNAYEWGHEETNSFSFHQITCYPEVDPNRIVELFGEDYDCFILDFGTDIIANKDEFLRCGTKIIVGGRSEWDRLKLLQFSKASETMSGSDTWLYFIPQANIKTLSKIRREVARKVLSVPGNQEPTIPSHITNRFFGELFRS